MYHPYPKTVVLLYCFFPLTELILFPFNLQNLHVDLWIVPSSTHTSFWLITFVYGYLRVKIWMAPLWRLWSIRDLMPFFSALTWTLHCISARLMSTIHRHEHIISFLFISRFRDTFEVDFFPRPSVWPGNLFFWNLTGFENTINFLADPYLIHILGRLFF